MVRMPVRADELGLVAAVKLMVAGPVPLVLPVFTVSHDESLVAVQLHAVPLDTSTLPVPPAAAMFWPDALSEKAQAVDTSSTAPVLSDESVVIVTDDGTASANVTLCPGLRMKSVTVVLGCRSCSLDRLPSVSTPVWMMTPGASVLSMP